MRPRLQVRRTTAGRVSRHDERGGILIMVALSLLVMIGLAAVVVDIGFLRWDKRASQTTADMASVAGALSLPAGEGSGLEACRTAWQYFLENSNSSSNNDPCDAPIVGDFDASCVVDPADPNTPVENEAQGTVGDYVVTITWPVRDDNDELLQDRDAIEDDGDACDRISVQVERVRGFVLAGVFDQTSGFTTAPSVARVRLGDNPVVPALIVLDRENCHALLARGQGEAIVRPAPALDEDGDVIDDVYEPGIIALDSVGQGDCGASKPYTMETRNEQHSTIWAGFDDEDEFVAGEIWSYALEVDAGHPRAYKQSNVDVGRLRPRPGGHPRVTRAPIDHRYDCYPGNPALEDEETRHPVKYDGCADGGGPWVSNIASHFPTGQEEVYTEYMAENYPGINNPCQAQADDDDVILDLTEATNTDATWWLIDCEPRIRIPDSVVIPGGNVKFAGSVELGSDGELYVGYDSSDAGDSDAFVDVDQVVVWIEGGGNLQKGAQATLALHHTFVYIEEGKLALGGGDNHGMLHWTAPGAQAELMDDPADPDDLHFWALALWSDWTATHDMSGQGDLTLQGIYFTPNARVEFTGQGGQTNEAQAQFWSHQLEIKGQGTLVMNPDPAFAIDIPSIGAGLIR